MSNKEKITQLEKEIKNIDKILFILLIIGIAEIILTTFEIIDLNVLSLITISVCSYLFFQHAKKRNTKDTMIRIYYAMELSEEEYDEKFNNQ